MNEELYDKFAETLKEALCSKIISFPADETVTVDFDPISPVFRVITRETGDIGDICPDDFLSHIERYKRGERIKGFDESKVYDIRYYSCSFFKKKDDLKRIMKLPKKKKHIIIGELNSSNGVVKVNEESTHVDLWLFKNSSIYEQFRLDGGDEQ